MREKLLEMAEIRNYYLGREVKKRIICVDDLVASEAQYHQTCYIHFFKTLSSSGKRGRPEVSDITSAMEIICSFMENSDECQFSLEELLNLVEGYKPNEKTVKTKLIEKYGDSIVIASNSNKKTTICFKGISNEILTNAWYTNKKVNKEEERLRILKTAATIITDDVKLNIYDTSFYESSDDF